MSKGKKVLQAKTAPLLSPLMDQIRQGDLPQQPASLFSWRKRAFDSFLQRGFPTRKEEAWRKNRLDLLLKQPFALAKPTAQSEARGEDVISKLPFLPSVQLVFVNGFFAPSLSQLPRKSAAIEVQSLQKKLMEKGNGYLADLTKENGANPFAALNHAFFQDGAWIEVKEGQELSQPIVLHFLNGVGQAKIQLHPCNLLRFRKGSRASVLVRYQSLPGSEPCFVNALTKILLEKGAALHLATLQRGIHNHFYYHQMQVEQVEQSSFSSFSLTSGSTFSRNDIYAKLLGEAGHCTLNGFFLATKREEVDHHTSLEHIAPLTSSSQLYKGLADQKGHGIFSGRIAILPEAQQVSAQQQSRNVLLSSQAKIDTQPQLQIDAEDVKCAHGATVGELNSDWLFYLLSRGISQEKARALLLSGFARETILSLEPAEMREYLEAEIKQILRKTVRDI